MVKTTRESFLKVQEVESDLDAVSLLGETGMTSAQVRDAVVKMGGVTSTASEIDDISANGFKLIIGKNLFNIDTFTKGYFLHPSTGIVTSDAVFGYSDYIPVLKNQSIKPKYILYSVIYYDKDKNFISGYTGTITQITIPDYDIIKYIRISCTIVRSVGLQLEYGTTSTYFEPYKNDLNTNKTFDLLKNTEIQTPIVAPKLYIPKNATLDIYHENLYNDSLLMKGKSGITSTIGVDNSVSCKLTTATVGKYSVTITTARPDFRVKTSKSIQAVVSDTSKTTAVNILNIGDSYTYISGFTRKIISNSSNISFYGCRYDDANVTKAKNEGRSGWSMTHFFTVDSGGLLSPFMQPVNSGYLYYGKTSFWIEANKTTPAFGYENYDEKKLLFNPTTGYKLSPSVGDIMYSGSSAAYVQWNGTTWVSISNATFGGFTFNFAKYRQAWDIPTLNIVHILMGTNDFLSDYDSFEYIYNGYIDKYNQMIASIKADLPSCKIIVAIPASSARQGLFGTLLTETKKYYYRLLAKNLISTFENREAENIYLLDYHSTTDREYAFTKTYSIPFTDYTGTGNNYVCGDTIHVNNDGHNQMGTSYYGIIQELR